MANGATTTSPGLSFPRATFARLTPGPFLHAHLKQPGGLRPGGRRLNEFRDPVVNTGSLTHSNGSAVVRLGDTAVVCGVRGEILMAADIPHPPGDDIAEDDLVQRLGLLVPNLELSTGCSPAHLPGNPPSSLAQSLSWRIYSLLHASNLVSPLDLRIQHTPAKTTDGDDDDDDNDDDGSGEGPEPVTMAYWTLYIDILCISLDGCCFDAAWIALMAALRDTRLPKASWDPDGETIVCSPVAAEASRLRLSGSPVAATFAAFSTASPLKQRDAAESWVLADPDALEEGVCGESVTVVVDGESIVRVEKSGGPVVGAEYVRQCVALARERGKKVLGVLTGGGG